MGRDEGQGQGRSQGKSHGRSRSRGQEQGQERNPLQGQERGQDRSHGQSRNRNTERGPEREQERGWEQDPGPGQGLVCGRKPVLEALARDPGLVDCVWVRQGAGGREVGEVLDACRAARVRFRLVDGREMERLAPGNNQGVAARLAVRGFLDLDELLAQAAEAPLPLLLALDQVQDPGNVGALARTLYALGGAGMFFTKDHSALIGPGAAKASAGAVNLLPLAKVVNLAQSLDRCLEAGFTVYGAAALGPQSRAVNAFTAALDLPAVLVLGGEAGGIRPNVGKRCQTWLGIPFGRDFDSLNVAQAGGILIAEFLRRVKGK